MTIADMKIAEPAMPEFRVDVITPHQNHLSFLICGYAYDEGSVVLEILEDADLMASWFVHEYRDQPFDLTVTLYTPEREERVLQKVTGLCVARLCKTSRLSWERGSGLVLKYTVLCEKFVTAETLYPEDADPYAPLPDVPEGMDVGERLPFETIDLPNSGRVAITEAELMSRSFGLQPDVPWPRVMNSDLRILPVSDPVVGPITHYDDGGAPRVIDDGVTVPPTVWPPLTKEFYVVPERVATVPTFAKPMASVDLRSLGKTLFVGPETQEVREARWRAEDRARDLPWSRGTED